MATKYIVRNGVTIEADKAMQVAQLRMRGYSIAWIAKQVDLSEYEVVCLLNVGGD